MASGLCAGSLHQREFLPVGRRFALSVLKSTQPAFPVVCLLISFRFNPLQRGDAGCPKGIKAAVLRHVPFTIRAIQIVTFESNQSTSRAKSRAVLLNWHVKF